MNDTHRFAAYGGDGWSPRTASTREEIGHIWGSCGVMTEWTKLKSVLLHRPGPEVEVVTNTNTAQWLSPLNPERARLQHDLIARTFQQNGVQVHYVEPPDSPPPNQIFTADIFFMTPEGAILGRPASTVRAGEERWVARRLTDLGLPILHSVHGLGTFEGADAAWLDSQTVLLATGLRTNMDGGTQVRRILGEMGVDVIQVGLPYGAMHLMGCLRFADRDLAIAWPGRVPFHAVEALRERGFEVRFIPDKSEAVRGHALNFVTIGPRKVLMAAGNPITAAFYESCGIKCVQLEVDELLKAAGGVACMTGILWRDESGQ